MSHFQPTCDSGFISMGHCAPIETETSTGLRALKRDGMMFEGNISVATTFCGRSLPPFIALLCHIYPVLTLNLKQVYRVQDPYDTDPNFCSKAF